MRYNVSLHSNLGSRVRICLNEIKKKKKGNVKSLGKRDCWLCVKKNVRPGMVAHSCNHSTLGIQGEQIMRSGVQDQSGQYGETPSLLKTQKLVGCGGVRLQS